MLCIVIIVLKQWFSGNVMKPTGVHIAKLRKSSVLVSWNKVESPYANLPVIGYECRIYKTSTIENVTILSPSETTFEGRYHPCVENIKGFSVASITRMGTGIFTAPLAVTLPSPGKHVHILEALQCIQSTLFLLCIRILYKEACC